MYVAEKNGIKCRIPDRLVKSYEFIGYTCTEIKPKEDKKPEQKSKAVKQEHSKD